MQGESTSVTIKHRVLKGLSSKGYPFLFFKDHQQRIGLMILLTAIRLQQTVFHRLNICRGCVFASEKHKVKTSYVSCKT